MTKAHSIAEIQRTAKVNGGKPLGKGRFFGETGIRESDWSGKYWIRWSDAILEAGFAPNQKQVAFNEDWVLEKYIALIRKLGHIPVATELRMAAHNDKNFPSHNTFGRFGKKHELLVRLMDYCKDRSEYEDIAVVCRSSIPVVKQIACDDSDGSGVSFGYVYLMKAGSNYKIGRSNSVGRREYELAIQLPDRASTVHTIRTDDPSGIEAYWHKRFHAKRKNGEWFALNSSDVKTFKRRKFM